MVLEGILGCPSLHTLPDRIPHRYSDASLLTLRLPRAGYKSRDNIRPTGLLLDLMIFDSRFTIYDLRFTMHDSRAVLVVSPHRASKHHALYSDLQIATVSLTTTLGYSQRLILRSIACPSASNAQSTSSSAFSVYTLCRPPQGPYSSTPPSSGPHPPTITGHHRPPQSLG